MPADAALPVDAALPTDAPVPVDAGSERTSRVVLIHDGVRHELRHGFVREERGQLAIVLTSATYGCGLQTRYDQISVGDSIAFELHPGPNGTFFSGHAVTPWSVHLGLDGDHVLALDLPAVKLEPLVPPLAVGARVRGTIKAGEAALVGENTVEGTFDLPVCEAVARYAQPATAPATPLRGKRGDVILEPHTIHAIVLHMSANASEVRRDVASMRSIGFLELYAESNVPCPKSSLTVEGKTRLAEVWKLGGTAAFGTDAGTPQPTNVVIHAGDDESWWQGWVQLSRPVGYRQGEHVRGVLWADAAPSAVDPDHIAGRFDAIA